MYGKILTRLSTLPHLNIKKQLKEFEQHPDYEFNDATILEDFIASGHSLKEIVKYAEIISSNEGIVYMHGPNHNLEQATGLVASGVHLIILETSEISLLGTPAAPILTISATSEQYDIFKNDLDFNAGTLKESPSHLSKEVSNLNNMVVNTLNGTLTKGEEFEIIDFGIQRIGPSI